MARQAKYELRHSQNFLVNQQLVQSLIDQAKIRKSDTMLEIGPGKGIITRALARRADHVIAIEKDARLAADLMDTDLPANVTLYQTDALSFPLPATPYRVFANIPFRHTAAIVGKLTTGTAPPVDARLVMQQEAAERYLIGATSTLYAQLLFPFFETEIAHRFHRHDFSPAPGVDCVLLCIATRQSPLLKVQFVDWYRQVLTVIFGAWQASLGNAIKSVLPRLASEHVLADRSLHSARYLKVSQVEPEIWLHVFQTLLDRDDDRVWKEIGARYQRITSGRQSMERPTRTRVRKQRS